MARDSQLGKEGGDSGLGFSIHTPPVIKISCGASPHGINSVPSNNLKFYSRRRRYQRLSRAIFPPNLAP